MKKQVDVLIISAGLRGCVAATVLNKAGINTCIVEKSSFPQFVIGESLLPMCMNVLDDCGLIEAVQNQNFQKKVGARFINKDTFADFNFSNHFTPWWSWTWQVPRSDFDNVLINTVIEKGVCVYFDSRVDDVSIDNNGRYTTFITKQDGSSITVTANYIIDSSGYDKVLSRQFKLEKPSLLPSRNAIFAHSTDVNREYFDDSDRIVIVGFSPDIWAWVIPFSNETSSLGFVGSKVAINSFGDNFSSAFELMIAQNKYLQQRFGEVIFIYLPSSLEGWSVSSSTYHGEGFIMVGNGAEFLDPIFSSGVMFSLLSSQLDTQLVVKELNGDNVNFQTEYSDIIGVGIETITSFINSWYNGSLKEIFFHTKRNKVITKQITSILAGYLWGKRNPFVTSPQRSLERIYNLVSAK